MEKMLMEAVHDTLGGIRIPRERISGVEDLFVPGGECDRLYTQMLDAYERLRIRLGVEEEDLDVENIISSLMRIEGCLSRRMYHYGALFGKKE